MRIIEKFRDSLKRNTKNSRLTSEIPAQYLARLPIQTYARQFRRGSETYKTPGWEKRLMKSSSLQTERTWKSSLMHSRQYMVPRAQEPHHSLAQMELVFWLIKKLPWKDGLNTYFDSVLNRPSSINDEAINRLPQVECNQLLDELPTVSETVKAIKLLSSGKVPGSDAIPAVSYKAGGPPVAEKLTELCHIMWRKEAIPQEFKDATIINLFKRKGNPQVFDNHRGISLLSIAGKILARVLLNRLNEHLERSGLLPESQCGFRKNRGTIDMIFTARQLQEKRPGTECGPLHDLCRPYQSIWHSQSWGTLENYVKVWLSCQINSNDAAFPW